MFSEEINIPIIKNPKPNPKGKIQSDPFLLSLSAFLVLVVEIKKKKCEIPNVCHDLQVTSSCSGL